MGKIFRLRIIKIINGLYFHMVILIKKFIGLKSDFATP